MDENSVRKYFPNASPAFVRLNAEGAMRRIDLRTDHSRSAPKLERSAGDGTVGAVQVQGRIGRRFLVRVTAFRKRLLDEDNLCEKYHVDLLRYAGVLPSDAPGTAKIEVSQQKVGPKEPERVELKVFELR